MTTKASKIETGESAIAEVKTPRKTRSKRDDTPYVPPEKMSKAGIYIRKYGPLIKIVDMRAVMK
jgi:hypothetical protein